MTGSVEAVWASWDECHECGSAISTSWAIPGGSAFSCSVAEFVTFKAPRAVDVSIQYRLKTDEIKAVSKADKMKKHP